MKLNHLTEEQLADLLAGNNRDACALLHVENCEACREELALLGAAIGDLNYASLRWAEQRAFRIQVPSNWALRWSILPAWGASLAALLIFGVALNTHMQTANQIVPSLRPAHTVSAPSDDELARDNRLMRYIDNELSEQVAPQMAASDPDLSSRNPHHPATSEVLN